MFELLQEFPDPNILLELQPEELGAKMLAFMKNRENSPLKSQMAGSGSQFLLAAFEQELWGISPLPRPVQYPKSKASEILTAISEAWSWLEGERLLTPSPGTNGQNGWRQLSRKAKEADVYSNSVNSTAIKLFPKKQIHPTIAEKAYPAFLRGNYDSAVFDAFREVEIAVRDKSGLVHEFGDGLMRAAFAPAENNRPAGPLTDVSLLAGEQRAMSHLFAGAFGVYRNSTGHRRVFTDPVEAVEVIMFASQLIRIVERITSSSGAVKP